MVSCLFWLPILLHLVVFTSAWPSYSTIFGTSKHFQSSLPFVSSSSWRTFRSFEAKQENFQRRHEKQPIVKHLTNLRYNGLNYVMVENLTMPFELAEQYCNHEFSQKMHLASVQSEDEWKILSKTFSLPYPSEIWLGGQSYYTDAGMFLIRWIDGMPFEFHRFTPEERSRWQANWRFGGHGCIIGGMQSNANGNWSVQLAPCTELRRFVCKEEGQKGRDNKSDMESTHIHDHVNGLAKIIRMLFGSRIFYHEPAGFQNSQSSIENKPTQSTENAREMTTTTTQATTQSPLTPRIQANIPLSASDNPQTPSLQTPRPPTEISPENPKVPLVKSKKSPGDEVSPPTKSKPAVTWSIPNSVQQIQKQGQPTKLGFNVVQVPQPTTTSQQISNQKTSKNIPISQAQVPAARVLLEPEEDYSDPPVVYPYVQDPRFVFNRPAAQPRNLGIQNGGGFILI